MDRLLTEKLGVFAPIVRPQLRSLPLVAALGLIASIFEGVGIGALIPLVAILLAKNNPDAFGGQLRWVSELVGNLPVPTLILLFGGAILGFMLLKGLVQTLNNLLISRLHSRISKALMDALAAKSVELDYDFFLRTNSSRLINIMSNDSWNLAELIKLLLGTIPALIGLTVFALLLFWLNWVLFIILVAGSLIIFVALLQLIRMQTQLSMAMLRENLTLGQLLLQLVSGARTIRIFNQEQQEHARFAESTDQVWKGVHRIEKLTGLVGPSLDFMLAAVFTAILLIAHSMSLPIPEVVAFLVLMARAQPHASLLLFSRSEIAARRGTISEVQWMLSQRAEAAKPASAPDSISIPASQAVHFEDVSYAYPDGHVAVVDSSFTIQPGTATALIGSSGSGKTTLVNLLCRLVEPSSGSILLGDQPLRTIDTQAWRKTLAVAGQDTELFEGSVAQNIAYGRPDASRSEIEEAAAIVGANGFVAEMDHGFDTRIGEQGVRLSGGQRQRISLARALLVRPQWLILDEATNAVDAMSENEIIALMDQGQFFQTLILISHRHSTLSRCQNGIVMENGRVVESGPLETLKYYQLMGGLE